MFDCETLAKARAAATRLDGRLRDLELQRQRLETEISCVRTIIGLCEPAQHLADRGNTASVAEPCATISLPSNTAASYKRSKPSGLPTITKMIVGALEAAAKDGYGQGLRPCDMAEFVRTTWWGDVQTKVINTIAWKMARDGQLEKNGSLYRLANGHDG